MGRKKIGLINSDNNDTFIDYIKARTKKLTDERVAELITLISAAKKQYYDLTFEFSQEYGVFPHEPDTLTDEHIKLIADIEEQAFTEVNALIDQTNGLKVAFKNAQSQARHKKKNKLTDNERFILEFNQDEYLYIKEMRTLCKDNGIKLESELQALYHALRKRCKSTMTTSTVDTQQ